MNTSRLHLRLITEEDADFLCQLMNTDKWHEHIGDRKVYSPADAVAYMKDRMDPDLSKKGFVNHVMVEKDSKQAVGTCSLHNREGVEGMDIGYALLAEFEGKGYAAEGAKAMIQLAFDKHKQLMVSAITTDENTGSCSVLEKLGFIHDGYIRLPNSSEKIKLYKLPKSRWVSNQTF